MEHALKENPQTTFIWAHGGISRRVDVPTLRTDLRRALLTYSNLFLDISWVIYPDYIARDQESLKDWAALIEEFPNRLIIGSDKVGQWATYPDEITKYYSLLDLLKPATAERLARSNILRLLGDQAAK